jgi:hypothetical protein
VGGGEKGRRSVGGKGGCDQLFKKTGGAFAEYRGYQKRGPQIKTNNFMLKKDFTSGFEV